MIAHGPPIDLVEHFVMPFSGLVICELMGVPFADRTEFRRWLDAFSSTTAMPPEEADANMAAMHAYIERLVQRRREAPADDLVSRLVRARDEEDKLSELELVEFTTVLLIAGHDTVAAALMVAVYVLLTHPEHTEQLRQRPELMSQSVQELLRYMPLDAYFTFARYATADVELSGTVIRAGEAVLPSMPSANRDAAVFDHPDVLDFERPKRPHLAFGAGAHRCPGASLATVELEVALSALLNRFPTLRLAVPAQDVPWRAGMQVRSLERLPVEW
jgi:cytochrome P450